MMSRLHSFVLPMWAFGFLALAGVARAHTPLPPDEQATFMDSPVDPPADVLLGVSGQEGRSYVTGNEWNLHLFRPALEGLGGGYVGVGSDQAYLFMGWQKPELAWLIDYDPVVIDIHHIYHALFVGAETPEAFRALWDKDNAAAATAALNQHFPGEPERVTKLVHLLRTQRAKIVKRLDRVKEVLVAAKEASFLTDLATYTWIRELIVAGRVRPMVADLMGKKGLAGIGRAAAQLGVPIRVLYVSNAEQYWDIYTKEFRRNVAALHVDEHSFLARTLLTWERNQDYRYNVQPMANFQAWVERPWVLNVWSFVHRRKDEGVEPEFFVLDKDVVLEERRLREAGKLP